MSTFRSTAQRAMHRTSTDNLVRAIERLRQASDSVEKEVFTSRVLNAFARVVAGSDDQSLVSLAGATSDYDVLLQILERPDVVTMLDDAPLAPAKLRGLRYRESLLHAEGGQISSTEAARILGISRQAVDKRRRAGRLIGLSLGRRGYAYPAWQFDDQSGTLTGLEDVLGELKGLDPWIQAAFMLNPNVHLDGSSPLEALRQGEIDPVNRAARRYGEQGAT